MHNADDHRDELFNFPIQGAGGQRSSAHLTKSAVDLWDRLPQGPALRIQVVEYVVVMGVPSHGFRAVLASGVSAIAPDTPVVSLSKGVEQDTLKRMTEVVTELLPGHAVGVLTGPNLAHEIMAGRPAASSTSAARPR